MGTYLDAVCAGTVTVSMACPRCAWTTECRMRYGQYGAARLRDTHRAYTDHVRTHHPMHPLAQEVWNSPAVQQALAKADDVFRQVTQLRKGKLH